MPTTRKRIGFLPSAKVHEIINEICEREKLSQSKVTGLLVEKALENIESICSNNINNFLNKNYKFNSNNKDKIKNKLFLNLRKKDNKESEFNAYEDENTNEYLSDEYALYMEFIEFKSFKRMLEIANRNSV